MNEGTKSRINEDSDNYQTNTPTAKQKELRRKYRHANLSATDLSTNFAHIHVSKGDFMGEFTAEDLSKLIKDLETVYEIIKINN